MLSWRTEHSNSVINSTLTVNDNAMNRLPPIVCNDLLNEFPTAADAIPAEIYKAGGLPMALTELCYCMCEGGYPTRIQGCIHNPTIQTERKSSTTTEVSLIATAGKILANSLLNRLNAHLDQAELIPESQRGFKKDRGTIYMTFTARQIQEKCHEQNMDLCMTLVGVTKAFDAVSRNGLWKIMASQIHSHGAAIS